MKNFDSSVETGTWQRWKHAGAELLTRAAASGVVPARLFQHDLPEENQIAARTGPLHIEIVSHCWKYEALLAHQLSSIAAHPPSGASVTMTVFHSPEDPGTVRMLEYFGAMAVPGVAWNWRPIDKHRLFRRAIGRNLAALDTAADWIWFTDCDVLFGEGCIDELAIALQGRRDRLVYPATENVTALLPDDDPLLMLAADSPQLVAIDPSLFHRRRLDAATGPMQITHGDVARAVGYCDALGVYQRPADRWQKAWEDRAFRWLLQTDGTPIDVHSVYRIRHASKGRYVDRSWSGRIRRLIRRLQSVWRDRSMNPNDRGPE